MKTLFTLEALTPVASILDEKQIKFTKVGDYFEPELPADSSFLIEFLEVSPVELEAVA